MSEWQPIESAPKDGVEVLAYFEDGGCYVAACRDGVWIEGNYLNPKDAPELFTPTHWMPLPDPPTTHPTMERDDD